MRRSIPLLLLALAASTAGADVVGIAHDSITTPGTPVLIGAKFERFELGGLWRPDLRNRRVDFRFQGLSGSARTDRDGMAVVRAPVPAQAGVYAYEATLRSPSKRIQGKVWVLDPARPLAVVDIDGTISDLPDWRVPFEGARAKTFADAPQLLRDLARTHQIVYLTARDDTFDRQTRPFLQRHAFPEGPVIYNDLGLWTSAERRQLLPSEHGAFKLRKVRELQALGFTVALGIGNAETDGYAYENAGVPSYLRTDTTGSGASFRFLLYADLRARLRQDGVLP